MLIPGKRRQKPAQQKVKSLYPVLHVVNSLDEYKKDLIRKEVESLQELSLVGSSFSGVLKDADHFHDRLQDFGQSFSILTRRQASSTR